MKSAHNLVSSAVCCFIFCPYSLKVTQRFRIQTQWKRYFFYLLFFELRFSKTPLIVQVHNSRHSFRKFLFISITTKNTEIFSMLCVKRVVPNINDHCQVVMNPSGLVSNDWALCWFSIGTSWIYIVEPIGTARQSGVAYVITYGKEI